MELPELPPFDVGITGQVQFAYSAAALRAYAEEAVRLERERCVAAIDDVDEPPWYGYECPNTFQDGKLAAADAIRARSEAPT